MTKSRFEVVVKSYGGKNLDEINKKTKRRPIIAAAIASRLIKTKTPHVKNRRCQCKNYQREVERSASVVACSYAGIRKVCMKGVGLSSVGGRGWTRGLNRQSEEGGWGGLRAVKH